MRITDYEHSNSLTDVAITLTRQEAEELSDYLRALLFRPHVKSVHFSEVAGGRIHKEIRFEVRGA